jgi:hypothetical protein
MIENKHNTLNCTIVDYFISDHYDMVGVGKAWTIHRSIHLLVVCGFIFDIFASSLLWSVIDRSIQAGACVEGGSTCTECLVSTRPTRGSRHVRNYTTIWVRPGTRPGKCYACDCQPTNAHLASPSLLAPNKNHASNPNKNTCTHSTVQCVYPIIFTFT